VKLTFFDQFTFFASSILIMIHLCIMLHTHTGRLWCLVLTGRPWFCSYYILCGETVDT